MIKLVSAEELDNIKEILKAETSIQKAQSYIALLQDNVAKARGVLTKNPQIIDLVDEKSDASVQTKKRKMPKRSSKDKAHNYVGDKSESENEDDLIPYKIPRKNEMKEIQIEKIDDEVSVSCFIIILCFSI
jgi:putative ribosome biogenesis GTPase RsgA